MTHKPYFSSGNASFYQGYSLSAPFALRQRTEFEILKQFDIV